MMTIYIIAKNRTLEACYGGRISPTEQRQGNERRRIFQSFPSELFRSRDRENFIIDASTSNKGLVRSGSCLYPGEFQSLVDSRGLRPPRPKRAAEFHYNIFYV